MSPKPLTAQLIADVIDESIVIYALRHGLDAEIDDAKMSVCLREAVEKLGFPNYMQEMQRLSRLPT